MGTLKSLKGKVMWGIVFVLFSMAPLGVRISTAGSPGLPEPQDALHEVMPGDNLHLIAGYYYGDARQWERIWEANRAPIPNPNRIARGMVLRIPDVTIPVEPYPDFVARTRRSFVPGEAPASTSGTP
jgi:hypothetical protein